MIERIILPVVGWFVIAVCASCVSYLVTQKQFCLVPIPFAITAVLLISLYRRIVRRKLQGLAVELFNKIAPVLQSGNERNLRCSILLYGRLRRQLFEVVRYSKIEANSMRPLVRLRACQGISGLCWRTDGARSFPEFKPTHDIFYVEQLGFQNADLSILARDRKSALAAPVPGLDGTVEGVIIVSSIQADDFVPGCTATIAEFAAKAFRILSARD